MLAQPRFHAYHRPLCIPPHITAKWEDYTGASKAIFSRGFLFRGRAVLVAVREWHKQREDCCQPVASWDSVHHGGGGEVEVVWGVTEQYSPCQDRKRREHPYQVSPFSSYSV